MAGQLSNFGANLYYTHFRGVAANSTNARYYALCTAIPANGTQIPAMAEVFTPGTNGYNRQQLTNTMWTTVTTANLNAGTPATSANTVPLVWGPFTVDPPAPIVAVVLTDQLSATTGNIIAWWALDTPRTPTAGEGVTLAVGDLVLSVT